MQRLLIVFFVILGFFSLSEPFSLSAAADPTAALARLPAAAGARAWLEDYRVRLVALAATRRGQAELRADLDSWLAAGCYLANSGGVTDKEKGFIIYAPETSLALFLLDRAETMCRAALRDGGQAVPRVKELLRIGDTPLVSTWPAKYPTVARAAAVLASLAVPSSALRGYRIYLLPFTMGAVSGQGGPGYTFIAAEPRDESLIPNQLEVTLVHEFGHYLHLTGMPREDVDGRRKWRDYLAARRMDWRDDGGVNTAAWARSPEETFAEDFRLLFGGRAAEEPAATAAGDPRLNDRLARRLRQLMRAVAADVKAPADPAPWPEEDEAWMAGRTAKPIFAVIPLGILLGLGIRRLPRRRAW